MTTKHTKKATQSPPRFFVILVNALVPFVVKKQINEQIKIKR